MILSDSDREFIEYSFGLINSAKYPSTQKLTEVYNRCFADRLARPVTNTNCGACIRGRIKELYSEMNKILKEIGNEE